MRVARLVESCVSIITAPEGQEAPGRRSCIMGTSSRPEPASVRVVLPPDCGQPGGAPTGPIWSSRRARLSRLHGLCSLGGKNDIHVVPCRLGTCRRRFRGNPEIVAAARTHARSRGSQRPVDCRTPGRLGIRLTALSLDRHPRWPRDCVAPPPCHQRLRGARTRPGCRFFPSRVPA
jgi:hypothetical protein